MDMNWSSVLASLVGGVLAISGGIGAQLFIARKERKVKKEQLDSDRRLIGALLSARLDAWISACEAAAADQNDPFKVHNNPDMNLTLVPPFVLEDIKGNWLTLSPRLIQRIHHLPTRLAQINRDISVYFNETMGASRHGWPYFLDQRAGFYLRFSGEISSVYSQLNSETGMMGPEISDSFSLPNVSSPKKWLYKQIQRWWRPFSAASLSIVGLCIFAGVYFADSQLESSINQGHYWSECAIARNNLEGGLLTKNRHVLKCGNRYEVVSASDYDRATRAWQQIQEPVQVPESASAKAEKISD